PAGKDRPARDATKRGQETNPACRSGVIGKHGQKQVEEDRSGKKPEEMASRAQVVLPEVNDHGAGADGEMPHQGHRVHSAQSGVKSIHRRELLPRPEYAPNRSEPFSGFESDWRYIYQCDEFVSRGN